MKQHFLLSAKARTLSIVEVARMSEDEARAAFRAVRFADNGGEPFCPYCGCDAIYEYAARRIFKCQACEKQFSLTSGTIFANRKLAVRDILLAIAMFVNGASGVAALRLGRELNCSYKTAFVLAHKLREIMGTMRSKEKLTGIVEVDGVWVGGHIKPKNPKESREDRRRIRKNEIKRLSIVTLRERRVGGRTLSFVFKREGDAIHTILAVTDDDAIIHVDKGAHWGTLGLHRDIKQVNHNKEYVAKGGVHTNWAESYNSRIRRAERGVHHRISGRHLQGYADEFAWREDYRRVSNGQQFAAVMRAGVLAPISSEWKGYWQRRSGDDPGANRPVMRVP